MLACRLARRSSVAHGDSQTPFALGSPEVGRPKDPWSKNRKTRRPALKRVTFALGRVTLSLGRPRHSGTVMWTSTLRTATREPEQELFEERKRWESAIRQQVINLE